MISKFRLEYFMFFITILISFNVHSQAAPIHYSDAYNSIKYMLSNNGVLDFKEAVYLTENTYFNNDLNQDAFENIVHTYSSLCKSIMNSDNILYSGIDKDKANAQYAVFLLMTDSIQIKAGIFLEKWVFRRKKYI